MPLSSPHQARPTTRRLAATLVGLLSLGALTLAAPQSASAAPSVALPDSSGPSSGWVVTVADPEQLASLIAEVRAAGGAVTRTYDEFGGFAARLDAAQAEALAADPRVRSVDADEIVDVDGVSDTLEAVPGEYIVKVKPGVSAAAMSSVLTILDDDIVSTYSNVFRGFHARLSDVQVKQLSANSAVSYVEPNYVATITGEQTNPPSWGLDRIDQENLPLNQRYVDRATGSGVTAYIVDTGIESRPDFASRLVSGRNFSPDINNVTNATNTADCNGHGTHVAGTVGGTTYGVAKQVTLVPVRVLNCSGSGTSSSLLGGLDWIITNHTGTTPAVANFSLGFNGIVQSIDDAIQRVISDGVIVAVAAGNSAMPACNYTPARSGNAVTVGATSSNDTRASFSNYGSCVDLFAPGAGITSTWCTASGCGAYNGVRTISGTSMATPHVAGAAAVIWSTDLTRSASAVTDDLLASVSIGKVTDPGSGSPNKLLFVSPGTGTAPQAPTGVTASVANGVVTVSWTAPTNTGSAPISGYTALSSSGGGTCSWSTGPLSCTISGLAPSSTPYTFTVTASNQWGSSAASAPSNGITISAGNDLFAGATVVSGLSGTTNSSNRSATTETNEPSLVYGSGGATIWFRYDAPATGPITINTSGSNFDTVLTVYRVNTADSITGITQVAVNDDFAGTLQSSVTTSMVEGTRYYIRIGSYGSGRGDVKLNWSLTATCVAGTPSNNNFCAAASLMPGTVASANNTGGTVESGEPAPSLGSGAASLWWTYTSANDGTLNLTVNSPATPTVTSVFTGATLASLARPSQWADTGGTNNYSASLNVVANTRYYLRIASFGSATGAFSFSSTFMAAPVTTIPAAPATASAIAGTTDGTIDVSWTAPADDGGSPITSYIATVSPSGASCVTDGAARSCSITGLVNWTGYTVTVAASNAVGRGPTTAASGIIRPGNRNDWFAYPKAITDDTGSLDSRNTWATFEPGEPAHARSGPARSMWFTIVPSGNGQLDLDTVGSNFDTVLAVYTGSTFVDLQTIASNDDAKGKFTSEVSFSATAGTIYRIAVDGYGTSSGSIKLNWRLRLATPPATPTGVVAVSSRSREADVSWTASANQTFPVTSYVVTATPGGRTCTWTTGPLRCAVTGLTNGTAYTFTVRASNSVGTSAESAPSNSVTPRTMSRVRVSASTWGQDRSDQAALPLDGFVSSVNSGEGAVVFVVDTGVRPHSEFGSRLVSGVSMVADGNGTNDCQGHGTHVASTAAGSGYGIATRATIVPVRVLDCTGSGYTSAIIGGLNWIANYPLNGRRGVVNLSLGGGTSASLDYAVASLVSRGFVVVVAAGNEFGLACDVSPAREPSAITVGATEQDDYRAWFSNYGSCLDIFAPGVGILGAGIDSSTDTAVKSGTSMAAPHVAGAAAIVLTAFPTHTPAQVLDLLVTDSTKNVVQEAGPDSPNRLLMIAGPSMGIQETPTTVRSVNPSRLFDTRSGIGGVPTRKVGGDYVLEVQATGRAGVPDTDVSAVSMNVTVVDAEGDGFVTVYPCGTRPNASNLNFQAGQIVPNAVISPLSADGRICFYSSTPVHLIADVNGSMLDGNGFRPVAPSRLLDTRGGAQYGNFGGVAEVLEIPVLGTNGIPGSGVSAVSMNVTVTDGWAPGEGGYVTVYPCGTRPDASNLNFRTGETVPNAVITPVSPTGTVCFYVYGRAHLIADVNGSFESGLGFVPVSPTRLADTRRTTGASLARRVGTQAVNGESLTVQVAGSAGIPTDATAASLNVTVIGVSAPDTGGFVTVYPCGTRPDASNLNFRAGQIIPNAVVSPLSAAGTICLYVYGSADLLVDVNGYIAG